MNLVKNHSKRVPIIFSILTFLGLVFLTIYGIHLAKNELIVINSQGNSTITIVEDQEYFILLDTGGVREKINVRFTGNINYVEIEDEDGEIIFSNSVLIIADSDETSSEIEELEFDKQITTKGSLSFGKVTLEKGDYIINVVRINSNINIGSFSFLEADYVNDVGFFSFSAIFTFTFALLGFKTFKDYRRKQVTSKQ